MFSASYFNLCGWQARCVSSVLVLLRRVNTKGLEYVISLGIGSMIVCSLLWFLRFIYHWMETASASEAYNALPSFNFRVMWKPAFLSGILWSLGNVCGIMSVRGLGQGVGYSVVQSAMMISGCWGIFFYKEVAGRKIIPWLLSAGTTIVSIIWISYEHVE